MAKLKLFLILAFGLVVLASWWVFSQHFNNSANAKTDEPLFGRNFYNDSEQVERGSIPNDDYQITFPKDHSAHPDFDIEWWYLTANLNDQYGKEYGLQWTLFRFRNPIKLQQNNSLTPWNNQQIYMAHASLHTMDEHWFTEKFARGGVGNASITKQPFSLNIDNWQWINSDQGEGLLPATLKFHINDTTDSNNIVDVNLRLEQNGPYVLHGDNGYSIKSAGKHHVSHYYSAPFIQVSGEININSNNENHSKSTPKLLSGKAWFDQEWTSQLLDQQTLGWDWVSLHLDDGSKLMAFRMRLKNQEDYITGSYIQPDGVLTTLKPGGISLEPTKFETINTKLLPLSWDLNVPSKNIAIQITSKKKDQWNPALVDYYEGMVKVSGSHTGEGFLELTGY